MSAPSFVATGSVLDDILRHKAEEIGALSLPELKALASGAPHVRDFVGALHRPTVALIAEVKKASPSRGLLAPDFDPVAIGTTYADNGAAAISVLVDQKFFQGHVDYLRAVRAAVSVPVLYKEFVLDAVQVYHARAAGSDAVLLIAAALVDAQLVELKSLIESLGMAALIEVHDADEMQRALALGAALIGINNRDLRTFREDLSITERLAALVPPTVTLVAESAIRSESDVARMGRAGAHAVLVGEALIKAVDRAETVRTYASQSRTGD